MDQLEQQADKASKAWQAMKHQIVRRPQADKVSMVGLLTASASVGALMNSLEQQADTVSKVRLTMEHQIIRTQQADKVSIVKDGLGRKNNVRAGITGQDTSRLHLRYVNFVDHRRIH